MRGQRTGYDAAPVVIDPAFSLAAKVVMELRHVRHDFLDGISIVGCRYERAAKAAKIRSDAVPPVGGECVRLGAPHQTYTRPAVEDDHSMASWRETSCLFLLNLLIDFNHGYQS